MPLTRGGGLCSLSAAMARSRGSAPSEVRRLATPLRAKWQTRHPVRSHLASPHSHAVTTFRLPGLRRLRRSPRGRLRRAARGRLSTGIDVYFENVGGGVQQTVWPLLNDFARISLYASSRSTMRRYAGPHFGRKSRYEIGAVPASTGPHFSTEAARAGHQGQREPRGAIRGR